MADSKDVFKNRIIGYDTKPADQFQANALNYRKHPQRQRDAVNASLREIGWIATVIENRTTGNLIDGHERVWQALRNNEDVPYLQVELSEEEERLALAIFDPITNMAETDAAILDELLQDVNTGEAALQELLATLATDAGLYVDDTPKGEDPGADVSKADELQAVWNVQPGDLWQLGAHRLICGDCTDAETVARVMGGEKAETLVFDPEWDAMPDAMAGYASTLAFCDGATLGAVVARYSSPAWVFVWDCVTSWYTPNRPLRRMKLCAWYGDITDYQFDGWHYGDAGEVRNVQNTRGEYTFRPDPRGKHLSDVYQEPITGLHADSIHNHSKPADWITLLIANCTTGIVHDPFLGSGTTLIACERLNRRCRAVEISPAYCGVAIERWHQMTGQTPVLVSDS